MLFSQTNLPGLFPPPNSPDMGQACQCFCCAFRTGTKKCIPHGQQNNHIPCWDAVCENLYQTLLQYPEGHESSRAATVLPKRKRRHRCSKAVQSIDFSHTS